MSIEEPKCFARRCVHFRGVKQDQDREDTERVTCDAFPDGIPNDIAYGDNPHDKPVEGDGGIRYERAG